MNSINTIQRMKTEPVLEHTRNVIRHYARATDCSVMVLDIDLNLKEVLHGSNTVFSCSFCREYLKEHYYQNPDDRFPCYSKHTKAIKDSCRLGGSHVYSCDLGFLFWASPVFSGGQFAGALIGSGALGIASQQAAEKIQAKSNNRIPMKKIQQHLNSFTERNSDDLKALAVLMMICAQRLSAKNKINGLMLYEKFKSAETIHDSKCFENNKDHENEARLLASLHRGDRQEAQKIIFELTEPYLSKNNHKALQIRAIELLVLISRAAANNGNSNIGEILDENDRYLLKIEDTGNTEEIMGILISMINVMAGKMFLFQGVLHSTALIKAVRFIWKNYSQKISLKEIAKSAGLSAPYLCTIFREEMGIYLSQYINKLRVVKAAVKLINTDYSINKIAAECGFEDQSWFSKIFKSKTGISPGKFREYIKINGIPAWINDMQYSNMELKENYRQENS